MQISFITKILINRLKLFRAKVIDGVECEFVPDIGRITYTTQKF